MDENRAELFATIGGLAAISGYITIRLYQERKMQRRADEIIRQINDLPTRLSFRRTTDV